MAIRFRNWDFNKEMVSMGAAFLVWVVYQTYSISEWKTKTDDMLTQIKAQTESIADIQKSQGPDHEHRLTILETQIPAIRQGVDDLKGTQRETNQKLDTLIEKIGGK